MTKSTITRERLEALAVEDDLYNYPPTQDELNTLARMALAAMDSEPVQMFGIGSIFKPQRVIEQEADCDDCAHYNPKICHGEGCPAISQQSAQPAPVVPQDVLDALQKVARIRLDLNDFDGDRRGIADCLGDAEEALIEIVNRRAAMLQELQKSAGASNNCRSSENVQVMQDVSRCSTKAAPALDSPPKTAEARCGNSPAKNSVAPAQSPIDHGYRPECECSGCKTTARICAELAGNSPVIPDGYVMVPKEPTERMVIAGFESEPDEGFSELQVWEAYEDMSGCEQAAHRARLCWAAMLAAAPQEVKGEHQIRDEMDMGARITSHRFKV